MAKAQSKPQTDVLDTTKVQVIRLTKGDGAYGLTINEHAEVVYKSEPDVYAIFVNNIISATRRIFGF
jgi:hypothetical protein